MAAVLRNAARERLEAGELGLGVILRQARTVDIAPIMRSCGYDWLFLDLEHNSMDLDTAVQIAVAALGAGIAPVARVPAGQLWLATRFLDGGGLGIVVPHVDTPEEAQEIAQALRYPPQGHRSVAGGLPHFGYAKIGFAETSPASMPPRSSWLLETPTAIANADAIAAVPGIDSLLIGPHDLAMELGIPAASPTSASSPPTRPYATPAARTASSPGPASSPTRRCCVAISAWGRGLSCRAATSA